MAISRNRAIGLYYQQLQIVGTEFLWASGQNVNDAYEGHMILGVERMLMWTSNRLVLMKGTGSLICELPMSSCPKIFQPNTGKQLECLVYALCFY